MEKKIDIDFVEGKVILKGSLEHALGKVELAVDASLVEILKVAAAKTDNKIDDQAVAFIEKLLAK